MSCASVPDSAATAVLASRAETPMRKPPVTSLISAQRPVSSSASSQRANCCGSCALLSGDSGGGGGGGGGGGRGFAIVAACASRPDPPPRPSPTRGEGEEGHISATV